MRTSNKVKLFQFTRFIAKKLESIVNKKQEKSLSMDSIQEQLMGFHVWLQQLPET